MNIDMKTVVVGLLVLAAVMGMLILWLRSLYLKDTNPGMGQLSGREPEEEEEEEVDEDTKYKVRLAVADITYVDTDGELGVSVALRGAPGIYTLMWDNQKNVLAAYDKILLAQGNKNEYVDLECESTNYGN